MSEMKKTIRADLNAAMKAKDENTKGALRMLLSAILYEETNGAKHEVTDDEIVKIIAREIKKRHESAEIYSANGRQELADKELSEAKIFEGYQPQQLTDEELETLVAEAVSGVEAVTGEPVTMRQMGQVMKAATAAAAGRADGKRLSTAVRAHLQ